MFLLMLGQMFTQQLQVSALVFTIPQGPQIHNCVPSTTYPSYLSQITACESRRGGVTSDLLAAGQNLGTSHQSNRFMERSTLKPDFSWKSDLW